MPFLLTFGGMLVDLCGSLVGRVLLSLGLSFVTFTGASAVEGQFTSLIQGVDLLPPSVLAVASLLKLDVVVNIVLSTFAISQAVAGLSAGGSITRLVRGG